MSGVSITPENILNAPSTPVTNATRQSKPEHRTLDLETLSVHEDASDVDAASTVALRDASPDMAATADSGDWQQSSTLSPSSDTVSPIYPDRLIRPLPKRKLRSRLSENQAGSIAFPPSVPSSPSMFGLPPSQAGNPTIYYNGEGEHLHHDDSHDEHDCACGGDLSEAESEEDDGGKSRPPPGWVSRQTQFHGPSSTSSADGYESFENTNNKKKRKIPVAAAGVLGPDMMALKAEHADARGLPSSDAAADSPIYASPSSGVGLSGPGRGRYGRQPVRTSGERRPLGASQNASNAHAPPAGNKMKRDWNAATHSGAEQADQGIISAAIANAEKRNNLASPRGQENLSLLQRQQQAATQGKDFTFECKSNSSNRMGMTPPHSGMAPSRAPPPPVDASRPMTTQGTQTARQHSSQQGYESRRQGVPPPGPAAQAAQPGPRRRRQRRPDQEYAAAARQRQMQQEINNYHHPPRKEDIWICEFCEYEAIWGKPPVALVRQYEIKDRKERKAAEERRRLLEKAKAKSRKNRKGKGNGKGVAAPPPSNQHYDHEYDNVAPPEVDSQGEEYFDEDEYDDGGGYEDDPGFEGEYEPPLAPVANGHTVPPAGARG